MIKISQFLSKKIHFLGCLFLCLLLPSGAFGFGLFITQDATLRGGQARTLLVQTSSGYQIITQGDLSTHFTDDLERKNVYWILPVFNIEDLESATPPQIRVISSAPLDELSELTAPQLQGACDDMPNGETSVASLPLKSGEMNG